MMHKEVILIKRKIVLLLYGVKFNKFRLLFKLEKKYHTTNILCFLTEKLNIIDSKSPNWKKYTKCIPQNVKTL